MAQFHSFVINEGIPHRYHSGFVLSTLPFQVADDLFAVDVDRSHLLVVINNR